MSTILSAGEILWDLFPEYKKPGGSPANLAYHLSVLGNTSLLASRIGMDPEGDSLIQFLEKKDLSTRYIQRDKHLPTGRVTVSLIKDDPSYIIHEPAAWDAIKPTKKLLQLLPSLDAFCFASLSQRSKTTANTIEQILGLLPDNCMSVFDVNLRAPYTDKSLIRTRIISADVIKVNEQEFEILSGWFGTENFGRHVIKTFPDKIVVVTLGASGSAVYTREGYYKHEAYPVSDAGDFVGVGDAFLACFIHLLLKKYSPGDIIGNANKYASFVASQKGSMPSIPPDLIESIHHL